MFCAPNCWPAYSSTWTHCLQFATQLPDGALCDIQQKRPLRFAFPPIALTRNITLNGCHALQTQCDHRHYDKTVACCADRSPYWLCPLVMPAKRAWSRSGHVHNLLSHLREGSHTGIHNAALPTSIDRLSRSMVASRSPGYFGCLAIIAPARFRIAIRDPTIDKSRQSPPANAVPLHSRQLIMLGSTRTTPQ